jgi:hypothetical protein
MAECIYCKTETELYDYGLPVCVQCAGLSPQKRAVRAKLVLELNSAIRHADEASAAFIAITTEIPSGLPHPDGTQQIQSASRKLAAAREAMSKAHTRLNDFVQRGIVPDDLNPNQ